MRRPPTERGTTTRSFRPTGSCCQKIPPRTSNASSRLRATLGYHSMPSLLVASPSGLTWRVSDNGKTKELLTNAKDRLGLLHPVITHHGRKNGSEGCSEELGRDR